MSEISKVTFCPNCCNVAPQNLAYSYFYSSHGLSYDSDELDPIGAACFVAICQTCSSAVVYIAEGHVPDSKEFTESMVIFPNPDTLESSVPKRIRELYSEAVRIKWLSASAFAGQIGRCLEAVCADRQATGNTLAAMLNDLAAKGEVPPNLSKMTSILRHLRNEGVHAGTGAVRPGHVNSINDFFKAVIEYIYVAPSKIAHLEGVLKRSKGKKI